jgi:hypothetical protein
MLLTRRNALSLGVFGLAGPALIGRAAAEDCTAPADLGRGVSFKRKDGSRGLARRESDGSVVIDYVNNQGDRTDRRTVVKGIFEVRRIYSDSEFPVVGSAPPEFTWKYSPKLVEPEAGGSWTGKVNELRDDVGYGAYMKEYHNRSRTTWKATYSFLQTGEANFSGCNYMTLPVEAVFTGAQGTRTQRWIYFPQLGFGIETKRDGVANGLIALSGA